MSASKVRNIRRLFAILCFVSQAGPASACGELMLEAAYKQAETVFIGAPVQAGDYASPLMFRVTRVLKGQVAAPEIIIRDVAGGCRGYTQFEMGFRPRKVFQGSEPAGLASEFLIFAARGSGGEYDVFRMRPISPEGGDAQQLIQKIAPTPAP